MLKKCCPRALCAAPATPLARLTMLIVAVFSFAALSGAIHSGAAARPSAAAPRRERLTLSPDQIMKPWTGDLDGMIKRGHIRVLTVYSKTFDVMDRGVQHGATYDAFRLFEEGLNKKLAKDRKLRQENLKVRVVFIPITRGDLLQALIQGRGDIAASNLTVTDDRQKLVDFSSAVYRNVSEVIVSGPASPSLSSVDDLAGKEIFVRQSSSYYESLVALNRRFASESKPAIVITAAPEELEDEDLLEMVNAGLIPLVVVDNHKAIFWKQVFPNITVHDQIAVRTGGEIAWAIRKGSPELLAAVSDFTATHAQGSTLGNIVLTRYLKNAKYVKDAASEAERKKFLALVQYFQRYGSEYDVDWLLMAAQGYQESQLNQAVRSKVGAVGVMQVMPATGKELRVGDITKVEPNIHAGIKYMRFMIDNYYANEPMTKLDKALFAFASYNAGAGRIAQLRKEAVRRGLDPNVWFQNVEYVASEKIGAETVTYVANIYKYYIAYNLILQARAAKDAAAQKLKGEGESPP